ncbi:MAG: hypothetical protein HC800_06760 [Phormidesmis sp. RL_2_1]|nr:hypothetical protein [Phormidesmis sp. RL_2_1]
MQHSQLAPQLAPQFAIITPSFAPDFERCRLLCESMQALIKTPHRHYVVVDRSDFNLFQSLKSHNRDILVVEDIIPPWIRRPPLSRKIWLSSKTLPIRNWLLQQIVKLETAKTRDEDYIVFVDSDVAFIRSFDFNTLIQNNCLRLYRDVQGNATQKEIHAKWHRSAARLLNLPTVDAAIPDYIGNLITWRRRNVVALCEHLENVFGRSWIEVVGNTWHFSEYVLYGTYVERVLKEKSGHYYEAATLSHDYWLPTPLNDDQLKHFFTEIPTEKVAIMLSAKAGIAVERYASLCQQI